MGVICAIHSVTKAELSTLRSIGQPAPLRALLERSEHPCTDVDKAWAALGVLFHAAKRPQLGQLLTFDGPFARKVGDLSVSILFPMQVAKAAKSIGVRGLGWHVRRVFDPSLLTYTYGAPWTERERDYLANHADRLADFTRQAAASGLALVATI